MQDVTISAQLIQDAIQASLPEVLKDKLSSSYSSPLSKIIDEELKNQDGAIRIFVSNIISEAFSSDTFKEELAKTVLAKIVEAGLKR